jgi:hypothetical protein
MQGRTDCRLICLEDLDTGQTSLNLTTQMGRILSSFLSRGEYKDEDIQSR